MFWFEKLRPYLERVSWGDIVRYVINQDLDEISETELNAITGGEEIPEKQAPHMYQTRKEGKSYFTIDTDELQKKS